MAELPTLKDPMPQVVRKIETALSNEWAKKQRSRGQASPRLPLSQLGDCQRKVWADLANSFNGHGGEPDPPESTLLHIFNLGDAIEEYALRLLRLAGYEVSEVDPATGKQWRVEDHNGRVSGRLDGIITYGREKRRALLEIKSANANQYRKLLDVGGQSWNPKYYAQIQYYMGLMNLDHCVFFVVNKNQFYLGDGTWVFDPIYVEKIRFDNAVFQKLRLKALDITRAVRNGLLIERPAQAKSQYCGFCKYCDVNEWCWSAARGVSFDP